VPRKRSAAAKPVARIEENPAAARLDTLPPEEVVALFLEAEAQALGALQAQARPLAALATLVAQRLENRARLVYVGDGTVGRVAMFEAAECGPLFGLPPSLVSAVIAGGPQALSRPILTGPLAHREAEQRLRKLAIGPGDLVFVVADEPLSPFLQAAMEYARFRQTKVIVLTTAGPANDGRALADHLLEIAVGPEILAEATRHKAATVIKIALATISSAAFIQLGKAYGGLMVDARPTTPRGWQKAVTLVSQLCELDGESALNLIRKAGGRAKIAIVMHHARVSAAQAKQMLVQQRGSLRAVVGDLDFAG
jgi:N-acetylmuramic acid 6-phosphate etherase